MAPPFPPKPKIGPLIRRSLFAATLAAVPGCQREAIRIGAVRIGPPPFDERDYAVPEPADPAAPTPAVDAGAPAAVTPADAGEATSAPVADAGVAVPIKKQPIRIGPPPIRIGPPRDIRIGPPVRDDELVPRSSLIRGRVVGADGTPLAHRSIRIELPSGTRIVATDGDGRFTVDGLPPGDYPVVLRATGYAAVEETLTAGRASEPATVTLR